MSGALLHLFKRIAEVCIAHLVKPQRLRAVRLDDDKGDAALAIIRNQFLDAFLVDFGGRTVNRCEDDDQNFAVLEAGERVSLAVYARQMKVGRHRANGHRRRVMVILRRGNGACGLSSGLQVCRQEARGDNQRGQQDGASDA